MSNLDISITKDDQATIYSLTGSADMQEGVIGKYLCVKETEITQ